MDARIKEKLHTDEVSATTFHSLGIKIIAEAEGAKPNLSVFAEDEKAKSKWVQSCFQSLLAQPQYQQLVLEYCSKYLYVEKSHFDFTTLGDYFSYLNDNDIRSLKGEKVKSFAELSIANWLFNHGIDYQYRSNYVHKVKTPDYRHYQPDFFLPEFAIYIEYYVIDENANTAPYIDRDKYHASLAWKRATHQQNDTQCIELNYAQHK